MTRGYIITHKVNEEVVSLWGKCGYCQRTEFHTDHVVIMVESEGRQRIGNSTEYLIRDGELYVLHVYIRSINVGEGAQIRLKEYRITKKNYLVETDADAAVVHRIVVDDIVRRIKAGDFAGTYADNVERYTEQRGQLTFL
jgi:hypothetical protein